MATDRTLDLARLEAESAKLRAQLAATQHRVRNTLAVIRSIARRSAETSENVEEYAAHLDGRIGAFARIQGALLQDPDAGLTLDALVSNALLSVLAREGERWTLDGPAVTLKPKTAELMGLALHELATNAVKFGALSWPRGRIAVRWRLEERAGTDGEPRLALTWTETGAPEPPVAARRGFSTELLENTLAYELGAEATLDFTPEGVICRIALPLGAVHPLMS
jgi:two-component system, chemotaxis family, CheB/CheR fusion protein